VRGRWSDRLCALLATLGASSCLTGPPPPDFRGLSSDDAREEILRNSRNMADLSASVSLSIESGRWQGMLTGALLLRPPGYLRLTAHQGDQEIFELVVTPSTVELYVHQDGVMFRDTYTMSADPSRPPTGSPLDLIDGRAIRLAIGRFELPPEEEENELLLNELVVREDLSTAKQQLVVTTDLRGGEHIVRHFDARTLFLDAVSLSYDGNEKLRATYSEYERHDGVWLPTRLRLEDLVRGNVFVLHLYNIILNSGAQPADFVLQPSPWATVKSADDP
jgi:hypothetical protein